MARLWRNRFPLTRMGLLLLVGAFACSAFRFYVTFAREAGDLDNRGVSFERRDVLRHFLNDFLFAGTEATVLFWGAMALMILGILRNLLARN